MTDAPLRCSGFALAFAGHFAFAHAAQPPGNCSCSRAPYTPATHSGARFVSPCIHCTSFVATSGAIKRMSLATVTPLGTCACPSRAALANAEFGLSAPVAIHVRGSEVARYAVDRIERATPRRFVHSCAFCGASGRSRSSARCVSAAPRTCGRVARSAANAIGMRNEL